MLPQRCHGTPVGVQCRTPGISERDHREGSLSLNGLLYADQTCFLQPPKLDRQVAAAQASRALKKEEVGLLARCKYGQDHEPCRFMDQPVNLG